MGSSLLLQGSRASGCWLNLLIITNLLVFLQIQLKQLPMNYKLNIQGDLQLRALFKVIFLWKKGMQIFPINFFYTGTQQTLRLANYRNYCINFYNKQFFTKQSFFNLYFLFLFFFDFYVFKLLFYSILDKQYFQSNDCKEKFVWNNNGGHFYLSRIE